MSRDGHPQGAGAVGADTERVTQYSAVRENIPDELKRDAIWIPAPYERQEVPHWQAPDKWMHFQDVHSAFPALVLPLKILCIEVGDVLHDGLTVNRPRLAILQKILGAFGTTYVEIMENGRDVHAFYHVDAVPAARRVTIVHTRYRGMRLPLPFGGAYVGLGRVVVMTGFTRRPRPIARARQGIFAALERIETGGEIDLFAKEGKE